MNKIHISLIALVALFVSGCWWPGIRGNGHIVTDNRPVAEFSDVKADGSFEIEWHPGAPSLSIRTDDNLLKYIESSLDGKTLRLHTREQIHPTRRISVLVTSPTLTGLNFAGAVRFNATQLSGPKFYLETAGACKITISGSVDELLADMAGASKLMARELHTKNADITTAGASKAEIFASEALRVSISGAGKVTYFGHPKGVERHVSGAGSINPGD
jgi:Putative auto-transporter adhesin, head GIN domain